MPGREWHTSLKPPEADFAKNIKEAARQIGVPASTVTRWLEENPDLRGDNGINLPGLYGYGRGLIKAEAKGEAVNVARELQEEELRKAKLENERRRIELERKKGALVFRDSVDEGLAEIRNFVRDRLSSLADTFPPEVRDDVRGPLEAFCKELDSKAGAIWLERPK